MKKIVSQERINMIKHLMARLLNTGILVALFFSCNVAASAATPTSSVDIQSDSSQIENETEEEIVTLLPPEELVALASKKIVYKKGYTNAYVKVRKKAKVKSKVILSLNFNQKVKYRVFNKKWVEIKYKKKIGYIQRKYISKKIKAIKYTVPMYSGYKSWMPYTAITSTGSPQYKLQHQYAYTGKYGIRMVNDRYCVAIGSYFKCSIGQYFDLVLANGTIIKCIKGDEKANKDTDGSNIFSRNGCATEFLIDRGTLASSIKRSGDTSSACKKWKSRIAKIKVYKDNILKSGR